MEVEGGGGGGGGGGDKYTFNEGNVIIYYIL